VLLVRRMNRRLRHRLCRRWELSTMQRPKCNSPHCRHNPQVRLCQRRNIRRYIHRRNRQHSIVRLRSSWLIRVVVGHQTSATTHQRTRTNDLNQQCHQSYTASEKIPPGTGSFLHVGSGTIGATENVSTSASRWDTVKKGAAG
jgi:hypothetical protein